MNTGSRIRRINEKLNNTSSTNSTYQLIAKMERWNYGFTANIKQNPKDLVTIQEWDTYCKHRLDNSSDTQKTQKELKELEGKIRQGDGFMEIQFVWMRKEI